jgi:sigma-B regulation protein RsbU (phosphoserine phosphatase)
MALSCTLIRTYAVEYPAQPELVLSAVNRRILAETHAMRFVTVFYGILDPATGKLVYGNAGHCPPIRISATNGEGLQELVLTGIPLGIYGDQTWGQAEVQLELGDLLVLYTDGITEARDGQGALFGEERLLESMKSKLDSAGSRRPSAQEIQDAILADVHRFAGDVPQSDDIALAALLRDSDGTG